ncbi:hypothetical protein R3W88_031278 [Solanum pinnatisectum]|uniref:Pectinesterase inhibitor domain-containing protein n=1 Tax=Solanum pinnatisectum TaxID=50273 RepID=A0AAV9LKY1_9SOLN|nr:hypothetical protein R3W88_031278 [Solanum pinnatisectum]
MTSTSFSLCSSLILIIVCAFLAIQSSSNPLNDVCTKFKNLDFCYSVLKDYSHQNLHDLTQSTISLATASASATNVKINKRYITLCATYYKWAISTLGNAQQYLDMGQYENLKTAANIVRENAFNCEMAFEMIPGYVSTITKENDDIQKFSDIIVVAANFFFNLIRE